jgi:hypothetical protein
MREQCVNREGSSVMGNRSARGRSNHFQVDGLEPRIAPAGLPGFGDLANFFNSGGSSSSSSSSSSSFAGNGRSMINVTTSTNTTGPNAAARAAAWAAAFSGRDGGSIGLGDIDLGDIDLGDIDGGTGGFGGPNR